MFVKMVRIYSHGALVGGQSIHNDLNGYLAILVEIYKIEERENPSKNRMVYFSHSAPAATNFH